MDEEIKPNSVKIGCVHGRYQPFHAGHLEHVLKAHELSSLLYVGLANSDPSHINADSASPHRHLDDANPFPYFARMEMVLGSLKEAGATLERIRIVPFPINRPELLRYYVPGGATHLITVFDEWGEKKVRTLREHGLEVKVLQMRKITTGTEVRKLVVAGESVSHLVPPCVNEFLHGDGKKYLRQSA